MRKRKPEDYPFFWVFCAFWWCFLPLFRDVSLPPVAHLPPRRSPLLPLWFSPFLEMFIPVGMPLFQFLRVLVLCLFNWYVLVILFNLDILVHPIGKLYLFCSFCLFFNWYMHAIDWWWILLHLYYECVHVSVSEWFYMWAEYCGSYWFLDEFFRGD